ncbi:MAG: DNA polymerase III subunit delta [Firmicutes bacterium HGW-Firmicutes-12]|jgi:DNA polymerase-3 subunit delta|nr:MAG: DNA polymerase III subunit delta [Firmicutes bacterium HGW-Firmicutes-12]
MQYQSILNSIDRGVLTPVYLICGDEDYIQEQIIALLKEKLINSDIGAFNFDEIDGEKTTPGEIISSANTLPVFAEKRLVIVKNSPLFQSSKKEGEEQSNKGQADNLLKYLEDPLASTCLVFWVKGNVDKRKKLVKAIEKAGNLIQIDRLKGTDINSWLIEETRVLGKKLDAKALEYIVLHGGVELRALKNELNKLALYAGNGSTITLTMVEGLLTKTSEANIFTLVDSIGLKKGEAALLQIRNLLSSGEPGIKVLFMIARQFRLILQAKDLERSGFTEKQMAGELSVHPFVIGKILRQAKNFSFTELENSMHWILECDVAMKTGASHRQSLEDLVLKLVRTT